MKRVTYLTIIAIVGVALGSCKKSFLAEAPLGAVSETVFYKSTTDFQQAVVALYPPLRTTANYSYLLEEMRADNAYFDYNYQDRGSAAAEAIAYFLDNSAETIVLNVWTANYLGIQRANTILDQLPGATAVPDSVKSGIIGETKALRAHYYFELVRLFGGLPLYEHQTTNATNAFVSRSSVDSAYALIISDFTDALGRLSAPTTFPQTGRATKGMVATELALVYMTQGQWALATPLLQSVTQMGYSLQPNYADIFTTANKNGHESIFEIQFKAGTDGQSSNFIYQFAPRCYNTMNIFGQKFNTQTSNYGGWNVPTQDLVNSYEPGDLREDASIAVCDGKYDASLNYLPDSVGSILNPPAPGEVAKYFTRKYYHPPYTNLQNNTDQDWYVYRYADVLLMLAECLNEQGQGGAALPYLNQVRSRAGLAPATATDQGTLRTIIAHERRVELAFENHRWFDLLRTGQAIPVLTAYGVNQKATYGYLLPTSYNVTTNRLIYPIPFRETQVNPAGLPQNPGY